MNEIQQHRDTILEFPKDPNRSFFVVQIEHHVVSFLKERMCPRWLDLSPEIWNYLKWELVGARDPSLVITPSDTQRYAMVLRFAVSGRILTCRSALIPPPINARFTFTGEEFPKLSLIPGATQQ